MSRKTCFMIFIIALIVIGLSYVFRFAPVTSNTNAVLAQMQNIYIAISAIVISLIMAKTKNYWLIMLGMAVLVAAVVQVLILGGTFVSIAVLYKVIAFMVYAYLVMLVRYML